MLALPAVIRLLYLLHTDTQPPSLAAKSIIISACYERGDSALSPQPRERLSESESNILVIIKVFVSLGGEKLDKLVSVPIIHSSCLDIVYLGVAAASGLEAGGSAALRGQENECLLCSSPSTTMPFYLKHPVPTYWSSVGTRTGHATPETCRPGWEA